MENSERPNPSDSKSFNVRGTLLATDPLVVFSPDQIIQYYVQEIIIKIRFWTQASEGLEIIVLNTKLSNHVKQAVNISKKRRKNFYDNCS